MRENGLDLLSRTEEIVLLAVYRLEGNAYGVSVRDAVQANTGISLSVGAVYVPLERLTRRGLLSTRTGEPTPERGGRSKRYYRVTAEGLAALQNVRRLQRAIWAGLPDPIRFPGPEHA